MKKFAMKYPTPIESLMINKGEPRLIWPFTENILNQRKQYLEGIVFNGDPTVYILKEQELILSTPSGPLCRRRPQQPIWKVNHLRITPYPTPFDRTQNDAKKIIEAIRRKDFTTEFLDSYWKLKKIPPLERKRGDVALQFLSAVRIAATTIDVAKGIVAKPKVEPINIAKVFRDAVHQAAVSTGPPPWKTKYKPRPMKQSETPSLPDLNELNETKCVMTTEGQSSYYPSVPNYSEFVPNELPSSIAITKSDAFKLKFKEFLRVSSELFSLFPETADIKAILPSLDERSQLNWRTLLSHVRNKIDELDFQASGDTNYFPSKEDDSRILKDILKSYASCDTLNEDNTNYWKSNVNLSRYIEPDISLVEQSQYEPQVNELKQELAIPLVEYLDINSWSAEKPYFEGQMMPYFEHQEMTTYLQQEFNGYGESQGMTIRSERNTYTGSHRTSVTSSEINLCNGHHLKSFTSHENLNVYPGVMKMCFEDEINSSGQHQQMPFVHPHFSQSDSNQYNGSQTIPFYSQGGQNEYSEMNRICQGETSRFTQHRGGPFPPNFVPMQMMNPYNHGGQQMPFVPQHNGYQERGIMPPVSEHMEISEFGHMPFPSSGNFNAPPQAYLANESHYMGQDYPWMQSQSQQQYPYVREEVQGHQSYQPSPFRSQINQGPPTHHVPQVYPDQIMQNQQLPPDRREELWYDVSSRGCSKSQEYLMSQDPPEEQQLYQNPQKDHPLQSEKAIVNELYSHILQHKPQSQLNDVLPCEDSCQNQYLPQRDRTPPFVPNSERYQAQNEFGRQNLQECLGYQMTKRNQEREEEKSLVPLHTPIRQASLAQLIQNYQPQVAQNVASNQSLARYVPTRQASLSQSITNFQAPIVQYNLYNPTPLAPQHVTAHHPSLTPHIINRQASLARLVPIRQPSLIQNVTNYHGSFAQHVPSRQPSLIQNITNYQESFPQNIPTCQPQHIPTLPIVQQGDEFHIPTEMEFSPQEYISEEYCPEVTYRDEFGNTHYPQRIFVGGFESIITEVELAEVFMEFGVVIHSTIINNGADPFSYGFVSFEAIQTASSLCQNQMDKQNAWSIMLQGRRLYIRPAFRKKSTEDRLRRLAQERAQLALSGSIPVNKSAEDLHNISQDGAIPGSSNKQSQRNPSQSAPAGTQYKSYPYNRFSHNFSPLEPAPHPGASMNCQRQYANQFTRRNFGRINHAGLAFQNTPQQLLVTPEQFWALRNPGVDPEQSNKLQNPVMKVPVFTSSDFPPMPGINDLKR